MENSQVRGTTTELLGILAFQQRGFYCSIPFDGSCRYDFIVDVNGKLLRIQSKSASDYGEGSISITTSRQTTNTQRTVRYSYSEEEIDYFYSHYNGYDFLIPVGEASLRKILRLTSPENGQIRSINVAHDYLIDNVLESILTDEPIKRYSDSYIVSENVETGETIEWSEERLKKVFGQRRLNYIKECCRMSKIGYGCKWTQKEFPTL